MKSRRELALTDESTTSVASSLARDANVSFRYLDAESLDSLSANVILSRSLTVNSIISTSSSFAIRHQQAVTRPELQQINQIGEGLQAAIFEQVGVHFVMKKEKPGNDVRPSNLQHEFSLHQNVWDAFERYKLPVKSRVIVPRPYKILSASDDFFEHHLDKFPPGYRQRGTLVQMDRILPLPKVVRRALVTQFYPDDGSTPDEKTIESILNHVPNKHCLTRTYLGQQTGRFAKESFSLRNFPLSLSAMQSLGLDVHELATSMGMSYAVMHWGACVSGDDVEFVLGTSAMQAQRLNFQQRAVGLYLLDFGQCDSVDLAGDVDAVYQAFKGAMVTGDNQLFIPHCQKSPELFKAFKIAYMDAAETILKDKKMNTKFDMEEFMEQYEEYAEDFLV